ncbi:MAG: tetratricopeptide repeat protein [Chitinophagales bacterium]|nr:tetratricopeptide repeat protein [Chitinophagales bacterium]
MKNILTLSLLACAIMLSTACQKKAVPAKGGNASTTTVAPDVVLAESGQALIHAGDSKAAILELDKAIEENPKNADAYYWRAVAKCYLSDNAGCCADYVQAEKLGHPSAKEMLEKNCK